MSSMSPVTVFQICAMAGAAVAGVLSKTETAANCFLEETEECSAVQLQVAMTAAVSNSGPAELQSQTSALLSDAPQLSKAPRYDHPISIPLPFSLHAVAHLGNYSEKLLQFWRLFINRAVEMSPSMQQFSAIQRTAENSGLQPSLAVPFLLLVIGFIVCLVLGLLFMSRPVFVVGLAILCDTAIAGAISPLVPLLHLDPISSNLFMAARPSTQLLSLPVVAMFIDGREKWLLQIGIALQILCTFAFAFTFSYWSWLVCRAASGIASNLIIPPGLALLNRCFEDSDGRAKAMQAAMTGISLGVTIGPVTGGEGFIVDPVLPWIALACVLFVSLLGCLLLPELYPLTRDPNEMVVKDDPLPFFKILGNSEVVILLLSQLILSSFMAARDGTSSFLMMSTFGWSVEKTSIALSGISLVGFLMMLLFSALPARFLHSTLTLKLSLLFGFVPIMLLYESPFTYMAVFLAVEMESSFSDSMLPGLLADASDKYFKGTGKVFVLSTATQQIGKLIGPIMGAFFGKAFGFALTCQVFGIALIVLLVWMVVFRY